VLAADLERFSDFSAGYLCPLPDHPGRLTDLRYSPLPHRLQPLWAIDFDLERPEQHVRFVTFRSLDADQRGEFLDLLLGLTRDSD
jgi:inner membrane protein